MTLKGIDVSGWQKGINLSAVPADFVIVKATGGTRFVNPECDTQFRGARAAGKRTGVYHFAHEVGCAGSAVAEADHFVDSIQGYLDGKTLLVLDFEGDNQFDPHWALTWLNRVRDRTGVKPLIYLNGAALKGADWSAARAADYGVWLAWYAVSTPTSGYQNYNGANIDTVTPPFPCVMWQFSSTARLAGYGGALDVNVFYGDGNAWDAYCRKSGGGPMAPQSTPTSKGLFMSLTPAEEQEVLKAARLVASYLNAPIAAIPGKVWAETVLRGGKQVSVKQELADAKTAAQLGLNMVPAAAPAIDVNALAAQIAANLTTNQAHQLLVALGNALPKA
jgi:GH25 family lysozyme M1 (1,4-beta-N-acetylmuramidase)